MVETTVTGAVLAAYDRLSDSEKRVADFILNSSADVSTLMATEVAKQSGTSNTTVSRFVRELGYNSYSEMRIALAREETAKAVSGEESTQRITLDDLEGSVRFFLDQKEDELEDTVAQLNLDELVNVVRIIQESRTVLVVGVGTSLAFAQMFAIKLSHVGISAVAPASLDSALALAPTLTSKDCIILTSNSGQSVRLRAILNIALDEAIPTVALTSNAQSPIAQGADHSLVVSVRDQILAEGIVLSHNSLNFVAEIIAQLLLHANGTIPESLLQFGRSVRHARSQ